MDDPQPPRTLEEALQALDIQLPSDQVQMLDRYRELLWQWNEKLNLTRHTQLSAFASRDVADSIQLARLLSDGEEVLDVGSGGGVPGVMLAILRGDLEISLSESVQKKTRALDDMVTKLGLPVAVHHCRAELLLEDLRFDTVVARAVGPLWKIVTWFQPHRQSFSRLLLIKGPRWIEERHEARERGLLRTFDLRRVAEYPMADTQVSSVILQLSPKRGGSG